MREADGGKVTLSGGFVTFQFKGSRGTKKFQLIAFVNQPSGASVLTFSLTGKDGVGQTAAWIASNCNVVKGVYACVGSEEWTRSANVGEMISPASGSRCSRLDRKLHRAIHLRHDFWDRHPR